MSDPLTPAAFLGHGSPMNTLETNRFSSAWRAFGNAVPRPRAILVVSAHWYGNLSAVTAMERPRTIHDFFGFPRELFEVQYPAPGDPALAAEVAELVQPTWVGQDRDGWGLDHGTWSVLVHAFPRADVPVVQLSIDARKSFAEHFELATRLAPLRARGVLVVGSGNVVHDLRSIDWGRPEEGYDWARRFDDAAREVLRERPEDVVALERHPEFRRAHPTPDHFIPLIYVAGLAAAAGKKADSLVEGHAFGSISMAAYTVDAICPEAGGGAPTATLPNPADVPPTETNT